MITVKVSDLLEKAKELSADGYDYVDIEETEADDEFPKSLHFEAYDGNGGGVDFEEIDHIDVDPFYKFS